MAKLIKTKVEVEGRVTEEYAWVEDPKTVPWDIEAELGIVGKPMPRIDGVERVTGSAAFTTDIRLPRMVHAAFLRSPHPHARVIEIDTSRAQAMPGVRAVFTHKNVPSNKFQRPRPLLGEFVRFVGDEVAVVAADTEEIARAALKQIHVEYEVLPFVLDAEQAAKPDAPPVHTGGNFLDGEPSPETRGDIKKGFAEADVIVEGVFQTPTQLHNALETHSSVADWDGTTLTVWDSTQDVQGVRNRLAELLELDRNRVRVIKNYIGGGFGAKIGAGKHTVMAAQMARHLNRPVRFVLDRTEENIASGNRSATKQYLKIGAKKDGTLTAIELTAYNTLGAYASWGGYVSGPVQEMYLCPNVRTLLYNMFTHTPPFMAFRAPGYVEGIFGLESLMDELAAQLGLDPLELRLKNYSRTAQQVDLPYSSNGLIDAYETGAREIEWSRRARPPQARGPWRIGVGMASQIWFGSGAAPSYALVKINPDASATVVSATQDLGTGTKTVLAQIAAEELGIPFKMISVEIGDTQMGVFAGGSGGSMTLASVGPAVREAAADARQQLLELAAVYLEENVKGLRLEDGVVWGPEVETPLADILDELGEITIIGRGSRAPNPGGYAIRTFGAQFAQVAVDIESGEIRVEKIIASHDSGRIINPLTTSSQIEGGVTQALGYALTEERILDSSGVVLNPNLEGYRIPTIADVPDIQTRMIDRADNLINNLGAKGVGEPPIIPTAAAIANAVYHATGIRFYELPLTRDRVLNALEAQEEQRDV